LLDWASADAAFKKVRRDGAFQAIILAWRGWWDFGAGHWRYGAHTMDGKCSGGWMRLIRFSEPVAWGYEWRDVPKSGVMKWHFAARAIGRHSTDIGTKAA